MLQVKLQRSVPDNEIKALGSVIYGTIFSGELRKDNQKFYPEGIFMLIFDPPSLIKLVTGKDSASWWKYIPDITDVVVFNFVDLGILTSEM